eukprot:sb/3474687/
MLTFPIHELNIGAILENLASMLTDPRQKIANTALEAIAVLSERLPARDQGMIYRAVEKIDSTDRRYYLAVRERLEQGYGNHGRRGPDQLSSIESAFFRLFRHRVLLEFRLIWTLYLNLNLDIESTVDLECSTRD